MRRSALRTWLEGEVGAVVYPWQVTLDQAEPDPALNAIRGEIRSVVRVGNRSRAQIGPLTAELGDSSVDRFPVGTVATASFKPSETRLVPLA